MPTQATVGGTPYIVFANASSGLPVSYSIDSSSALVCTVTITSVATVTFQRIGVCVINVNQAGTADYFPASQLQQSFNVVRGTQTIQFITGSPTNAFPVPLTRLVLFGFVLFLMVSSHFQAGPTYSVVANATSGLPVSLAVSGPCSIANNVVSFTAIGTCQIDADQVSMFVLLVVLFC